MERRSLLNSSRGLGLEIHAVAGKQIRRQSPGNTEADNATTADANGEPERVGGFAAATDHKHARPSCDPRLEGKPDKSNYRSLRQIIEIKRAVGVGQRPDRGRAAPVHVDVGTAPGFVPASSRANP